MTERVNKLKIKFDIDKIREEINILENEGHEYGIGDGRIDVGFLWFENKNIPEDWEIRKFQRKMNLDMAGIGKMQPKTCYAWHYDFGPRIHMAVHTGQPHECFFLFADGKQYHIPADGHVYVIDTTEEHTFVNAHNSLTRYHMGGHPHFLWSWDSIFNNEIEEAYS